MRTRFPAIVALAAVSLVMLACARSGGGALPAEPARVAQQEIAFVDFDGFDSDLSATMKEQTPSIVIRFPAPFSLNEVPERMELWLSAVKQSGGDISLEPRAEIAERWAGAALVIATAAYQKVRSELMYGPSGHYHALLIHGPEGTVDEVRFFLR